MHWELSRMQNQQRNPLPLQHRLHLAEFTGSLSSHFLCRLRASWRFSAFLGIFFPVRALLLASKMASVTLEVKINNQSCKQRKRRGRSSGKQVTNEKHIGASQVKQKRVTDRPVQAEVLMQGVNHTMFSRTAQWERAQKDFSTCSA